MHSGAKKPSIFGLNALTWLQIQSAPLFPSFGKNRETIESRRLDRRSVLKLVEKRARTSDVEPRIAPRRACCAFKGAQKEDECLGIDFFEFLSLQISSLASCAPA